MVTDTYVMDDEGTGIVHNAPGFGLDDHRICLEHQILRVDDIPPCPIDEAGKFTDEVPKYVGIYVKVSRLVLKYSQNGANRSVSPQVKIFVNN